MSIRIRSYALLVLFLVGLACGPLTLPTPTATHPLNSLPTTKPAPTPAVATEAPSPPGQTSPAYTAPQPAAAPHFHAGDPIQLDSISMKSQTEGWGLSGPYVLTTADSGQTWREATPPENFPSGTENQAYGSFLNAQTAWIVFARDGHVPPEASIWHTTDGGRNWTPGGPLFHQVIGDQIWAEFAVLDAQHVWVMIRGVYVGAGTHFNHELFRTVDGGLTWTSLDDQISDDYTGMVFADSNFGLRTLQTTGPYAPGPPAYDVTTNGGANWEGRELPLPPGAPDLFNQYPYCETYQPVLVSAQSIRMLVGCFDYHNPPKQFTSYFYSSQDGGVTWQTVHLPEKVQAAQAQLFYYGSNNALLLGRDIYLSTSGGQTWSFVKTVNWDGQFSFSDMKNGWAVARSNGEVALVQTTDWAASWTLIKPTITP
jgi:photosystem II stability/assembly factor-like uncharacterized protein